MLELRCGPITTIMPAKTKFEWSYLLEVVRRLWSELGHAPSVHAVNEAAGGGATNRIEHVITAVGIEHGQHVTLYATLPEDLRKLITDPKDRLDAVPEVDECCSPALATAIRDAMMQVAAACGAAERATRADAERLVGEAEARMAAELAAMSQRLQESAADVEAEARRRADAVAASEHLIGVLKTDVAATHAELSGRHRELDVIREELRCARKDALAERARCEQSLQQQQAESAAYAASLAAVTERALRAEAERDVVRELGERLTREFDALRRTTDEAAARSEREITQLRAELAASRQAHQDADRLRAVAEALLAEARVDHPERAA